MANLKTLKTVPNAVLMEDQKGVKMIRLDRVRFSYPFFGNKAQDKNDDGGDAFKWRGIAMLEKTSHMAAKTLVKDVCLGLIAEEKKKNPKIVVPTSHWFLSDGNEKEDEQMHGYFLVSASEGKYRPKIRNARGELMTDADEIDELFIAGHYGSMLIRPWYFGGSSKANPTKPMAKRLCAGLAGAMYWKKGEPFGAGGGVDDDDAWEVIPGGDDGDGFDEGEDDGEI